MTAGGVQRSSVADSLLILLRQDQRARGEDAVLRTVQQGNVVLHERRAAQPSAKGVAAKAATESRATGQVAEFDGTTRELTLTGSPAVASPGFQLAADHLRVSRATGDAVAEGAVKGSYWKSGTSTAAGSGNDPHTRQSCRALPRKRPPRLLGWVAAGTAVVKRLTAGSTHRRAGPPQRQALRTWYGRPAGQLRACRSSVRRWYSERWGEQLCEGRNRCCSERLCTHPEPRTRMDARHRRPSRAGRLYRRGSRRSAWWHTDGGHGHRLSSRDR